MVYEGRRSDKNTVCPNCGNVVSSEGNCLKCGFPFASTPVIDVAHVDSISDVIASTSIAARELVRNIKGEYQNFAGTFSPEQVEISHRYQFTEKLNKLDDDIETIDKKVTELGSVAKSIAEQTRDPTLGERIKDSVFENFIGTIVGIIIGIILAWLGFNFFF